MAKFAGKVGFAAGQAESEDRPGIVEEQYEEHSMRGDVIRASKVEGESSDKYETLRLSNRISIVADKYAYTNFMSIRYVLYMGSKWKVTEAEVQRPRIILTLGGVWNG